jgi:hypothetical protein
MADFCYRPGSYALTLTREDVVVWIINHDVSHHHDHHLFDFD